jgi:uncharacterized protein (TIGR02145 family)
LDGFDFLNSLIIANDAHTNGNSGQSVTYHDVEFHRNLTHNTTLNVTYNTVFSMAQVGIGTFSHGFTANNIFLKNSTNTQLRTHTFNYIATQPYIANTFTTGATECVCNSDTVRTTIQGNNATASRIQVGDGTSDFEIYRAIVSRIDCSPGDEMIVNDGLMGTNGNITNVTLIPRAPLPGINFYWVGGNGNWSDYTHWSINETGGDPLINNPNECIPSQYDNVFFDDNSFPADNPQVILDINGDCKDMIWTSDITAAQLDFGVGETYRNLFVYGSLELSTQMVRFSPRELFMMGRSQDEGVQTLQYHSVVATMPNTVNFSGGGRYDILSSPNGGLASTWLAGYNFTNVLNGSSLYLHDDIRFNYLTVDANSSFYSQGNSLTFGGNLSNFTVQSGTLSRTIDISGSTVTFPNLTTHITWNLDAFTTADISNTNITLVAGSANFSFAEGTVWNATNSNLTVSYAVTLNNPTTQEFAFHNIKLTGTTAANATLTSNAATTGTFTFSKVEFTGSNTQILGPADFIFDTLIYTSRSNNLIQGGKTLGINHELIASGTACGNIELSSTNTTHAVINSINCNPLHINFAKITNVHANISDGCTTEDYVIFGDPTIQVGANGWSIYDLSAGTSTLLGPDMTITCGEFPYTQTSEGFGIGELYTWYYRATDAEPWVTLSNTTPTLLIENEGYYSLRVDYGSNCHLGGPLDVQRFFDFNLDMPPAVITSNSVTNVISCEDPAVVLTANQVEDPGGLLYTYLWKDATGANWLTTQSVTVDAGGTYTVVVTKPSSQCTETDQIEIIEYGFDDLMECSLMTDKTVEPNNIALDTYTHSGTSWDPIIVPCAPIADSTFYITINGTDYSGKTLDGFTFPLGTTTVMWVAESSISDLTDTCWFDVLVMRCATAADITLNDAEICSGETITLSPSSTIPDSTFHWYASSVSSESLYTGTSLTLTNLTKDTTFFVSVSGEGYCENAPAERKEVNVVVTPRATAAEITANGVTICSGQTASLTATASVVTTPVFRWYASQSSTTVLYIGATYTTNALTADTVFYVSVSGTNRCENLEGTRLRVTVTVNAYATAAEITASNVEICSGQTASLTATASVVNTPEFKWYASQTSTTVLHTGATYTTNVLTADTAFYVSVSGTNRCENVDGTRKRVVVSVDEGAGPSSITANDTTICTGSSATLRASSAVFNPEFFWYSSQTSITLLHTGANYTTSTFTSDTAFYVSVTSDGSCENLPGNRKRVQIFVNEFAVAAEITANGVTICSGQTASLTATASVVTAPVFNWYASQTSTTILHTDATYTTIALSADTAFYVSVSGENRCENLEGTRLRVPVTVTPRATAADITLNNAEICSGENITLSPSSTIPDSIFHWYASSVSSESLYTGTSLILNNLTKDTTFFVSISGEGYCENTPTERKEVNVLVTPRATAAEITANGVTICSGQTASLTATTSVVNTPEFKWYASQASITVLHTGATYTTTALTVDTAFYVSVSGANRCENLEGTRLRVPVTVESCLRVSYNGNGNTGGTVPVDPNNPYDEEDVVTVLEPGTMNRTCHTFLGWAFTATATTPVFVYDGTAFVPANPTFIVIQDTTLYAVWRSDSIASVFDDLREIYYYCQGDEPLDLSEHLVSDNGITGTWSPAAITTTSVTPAGAPDVYTFTPNPGQPCVKPVNIYVNIAVAACLEVFYNGNGNTGGTAPVDGNNPYENGQTVTLLAPGSLTKTCYSFIGWAFNPTATTPNFAYNGTAFAPATFSISRDTILYAVWRSDKGTAGDIETTPEEFCSGDEVWLSVSSSTVANPVFRWYASQTATTPLHIGQHYLAGIFTSDTAFYVSVSGTGLCENDLGMRKRIEVPIIVCKLLNCDALIDRVAEEDYYLALVYTHTGTGWDAIPAMSVDSMQYFLNEELVSHTTLDGVIFPVGVSTVVVVAFWNDIEDACEFTVTVTRACPASIPDDEGNVYNVTKLAGLCWTENLKATKYAVNLGEGVIPFAKPYHSSLHSDTAYHFDTFGLLYDWYSAMGLPGSRSLPVQGICPQGWHIPSEEEWTLLNAFPAEELKSTEYWLTPGTDTHGFDARPAGWFNSATQRFEDLYGFTGWWSTQENSTAETAFSFTFTYYCDSITEEVKSKHDGLSVRCVMDY